MIGVLLKLLSPHRSLVSWVFVALVGGAGGTAGLFVSRLIGVNREEQLLTLAVAGGLSAVVVMLYAVLSRVAVTRLSRRTGRMTRPTLAF